jgi:hypothetical protein
MKRLVITESEKQRILGMHSNPSLKGRLFEQTDPKLKEILNTNNDAAWQFIKAVTAAEDGATLGTVDEDAIVKLVQGITTTDLYITILWNIRNNVQDNYCTLYGWAIKRMFETRGGEAVKMVGYVGDMDKDYREAIRAKTIELSKSACKYYPFFNKKFGIANQAAGQYGFDGMGDSSGKKGCKEADWTVA